MFEGFKKFIARGNMIDMAVGVVMGGAVTTVVNAIVNSVINPFIAMIFGKPNMDGLLAITFNGATVSFGAVLGAILNFLIIAVAVYFCILVPINKFRDMTEALLAKTKLAEQKEAEEKAAEEPSAEEQTVQLLQQLDGLLFGRRLFSGLFLGFLLLGKLGLGKQRLGHVAEFVDRHQNAEIDGDGDDEEIQNSAQHCAERNGRAVECDRQQTIHVRLAEDHGDERIDDAVDDRVDHGGDGTAHDDTDGHVDHVAACDEFLESFEHFCSCSAFAIP